MCYHGKLLNVPFPNDKSVYAGQEKKEEEDGGGEVGPGGKGWHLEGNEPDGTEPLLAGRGGQDIGAGKGFEVEGGAAVGTVLPRGRGGAQAVLEAHHRLLRHPGAGKAPLPGGGGGLVQHRVQLQAADPGKGGPEEDHPHLPPRLPLRRARKERRPVGRVLLR